MSVLVEHGYALRGPWYERERQLHRPGSAAAGSDRPAIQKYATDGFVDQLLRNPRDSLILDEVDDRWSYPVPIGAASARPSAGQGRLGFSTHRMVHTPLRKLYQPNHDRFYTAVIELFCDQPGLPLPGVAAGVDVKMVIRRELVDVPKDLSSAQIRQIRTLARKVLQQFSNGPLVGEPKEDDPAPADLADALWSSPEVRAGFEAEYQALLASLGARRIVQGWVQRTGEIGEWKEIPEDDDLEPVLLPGELEQSMWRIPPFVPPDDELCPTKNRGLWFGLVPTFSGESDTRGEPKLDDHATYTLRCFARKRPAPGHEHCPPKIWWSSPSESFRLASFFDPDGTKNHLTTVAAPDFRTLAARAGQPSAGGGLQVVRPPGSQMMFDPNNGSPKEGTLGGAAAETCTYAIQLLMIVAMFVFSLFLPIIMLLFQLWWLLLLRFCWPPSLAGLTTLDAHFGDAKGPLVPTPDNVAAALDEVIGTKNSAALLNQAQLPPPDGRPVFQGRPEVVKEFVDELAPKTAPPPTVAQPEEQPDDPLCRPGS